MESKTAVATDLPSLSAHFIAKSAWQIHVPAFKAQFDDASKYIQSICTRTVQYTMLNRLLSVIVSDTEFLKKNRGQETEEVEEELEACE